MRAIRIVLAAAILLSCRGAWAAEQPLELDGIRLGMSEPDVRGLFPAARCSSPKGTQAIDRECVLENPASETARRYYFIFLEGRLVTATIRFPAKEYDTALQATQSKYGKPASLEMNVVPDRSGNELQGSTAFWRKGPFVLSLERYSVILPTHSTLELRDEYQYDIVNERIKKRMGEKGKAK